MAPTPLGHSVTRYFCTYFDWNYLPRGLALYRSLQRHCPSFQLWVLCMDRTCSDVLSQLALPGLHVISLEDFEKGDHELLRAKQTRTLIEYYFTCSPSLPLFVLNHHPQVDLITYLDSDLGFFADPQPLYEEMGDRSIAIIGHRRPPHLQELERYGIYNVGWLSFRRDQRGLECLRWWRERCLEWCYDRCEDGRFADQKYLDDWPTRFQGVAVLHHKGANLAAWNLANYAIRMERDRVWVDEQPLIFFHFHRLKQIEGWVYDPTLAGYKAKASSVVRRGIYGPYIRSLVEAAREMPASLQDAAPRRSIRDPAAVRGFSGPITQGVRRLLHLFRGIVEQHYLFVLNGRVL
jgi:hypothetical protein